MLVGPSSSAFHSWDTSVLAFVTSEDLTVFRFRAVYSHQLHTKRRSVSGCTWLLHAAAQNRLEAQANIRQNANSRQNYGYQVRVFVEHFLFKT